MIYGLPRAMYEEAIRPLETPEFVAWFEEWYIATEEVPKKWEEEYLSERRFALFGWLASRGELPERFMDAARAVRKLRGA